MSRPKEIADRVYAVGGPGISQASDCCVYLVDAGDELVLIDSGAGESVDRIDKNIRSLGLDSSRIKHLIATHCHIDHIGGLYEMANKYGLKVIAHQLDRAGIEGENDDLTAAKMYGVNYMPVKIDITLRGEEETISLGDLKFNFVHTPGHTPGSISVYLDTKDGRILFGQDIHGPFSKLWGSDLEEWKRSMEKLISLNADILCEGHTGIYKGDKVNRYIQSYIHRYCGS
jgi:glyoxylase-like metal-dependent hydrolase (beta-lactamase superfamily II)